jgi:small-conductance mechanosensitive channel
MNFFERFNYQSIFEWLSNNGIRVLIVLVIAFLVDLFSRFVLGTIVEGVIKKTKLVSESKIERTQRASTIRNVLEKTITASVIILAIIVILSELGVPISSLVLGAGVIGLIIGLGVQTLIRDILSGVFILVENQFDLGDVIKVNNVEGKVIEFSLRRTVLEDKSRIKHYLPNHKIEVVSKIAEH